LYVAAARNAVFSRISAIEEEAISLKNIAAVDLEGWAAAHGVDMNAAQHQAEEKVRNLFIDQS
jgi:hypothetical protein